jgi:hypothetical protein
MKTPTRHTSPLLTLLLTYDRPRLFARDLYSSPPVHRLHRWVNRLRLVSSLSAAPRTGPCSRPLSPWPTSSFYFVLYFLSRPPGSPADFHAASPRDFPQTTCRVSPYVWNRKLNATAPPQPPSWNILKPPPNSRVAVRHLDPTILIPISPPPFFKSRTVPVLAGSLLNRRCPRAGLPKSTHIVAADRKQ